MNKQLRKILILLLTVIVLVSGCSGETKSGQATTTGQTSTENQAKTNEESTNYPIEITDQFDNTVTFEKKPEKIVSLVPSNTEVLFALGLGEEVVAVTDYCNYPEQATEKEKIGGFGTFNVERIIELKPDLVLQYGPSTDDVSKALKEAGIPVLSYEAESIEQVGTLISDIGKATGTSAQAEKLVENMKAKKEEILNKIKDQEPVTVFYEISSDPLMTAGKGTFMNELITLANGIDIAGDVAAYSVYDLEALIEKNPQVYLTPSDNPSATPQAVKERPGFGDLDAVKKDRVVQVNGDVVSRPGPRIIEALELFAKAIHPEAFK